MHKHKLTVFARLDDVLFSRTQPWDLLDSNPVDLCCAQSEMWPPRAAQHPLKWIRKLLCYPQASLSPTKREKEEKREIPWCL